MPSSTRPFGPTPSPAAPANRRDSPWEMSLAGELGEKHSEMVGQFVDAPMNSRGTLWIDSCGGSVYAGLAIATLIRLRSLKVTAVVVGECSSAALLPFAACSDRFVTPHATLLFHPMRWQSEDDVQLEEAAEWARHFKVLEEDLDELLAKLFPIEAEKLQAWSRPGRFLTGAEVAEAGLAKLITLFDGPIRDQIKRS